MLLQLTVIEYACGLAATAAVLDISDIMQFSAHEKSSSVSQLIKGRSPKITQIS